MARDFKELESSPIEITESSGLPLCSQINSRPFFSNKEIEKNIEQIVEHLWNKHILIVGEMGIGKSTMLCIVINRMLSRKHKVYYGGTKDIQDGIFVLDNMTSKDVRTLYKIRVKQR